MNPITEKRGVSGYYYAEEREYAYFVTDAPREQNYRFIFDSGTIYSQDDASGKVRLSSEAEFFAVVKKILAQYRDKILEHSAELENYEKIYTRRGDFSKFMKRHSVLKYEIRKFQNKISHFYEALLICANEQPVLKKRLKNYAYEAGVFKGVMSEYAVRIDHLVASAAAKFHHELFRDEHDGAVFKRLGARHAYRDACDVRDFCGDGRLFYALRQKAKLKRRNKI